MGHVLWNTTTGAEIPCKRSRQLRSSWWGPVSSCRHQRNHETGGRLDNLSGEWCPAAGNRGAFCTHCRYLFLRQWKFLSLLWAWPREPLPFLWVWSIGILDLGVLMSLIHIHPRLQPVPSHKHEKTHKEKWTLNNRENWIQATCFAKKKLSNGKRIFSLKLFIFNKCQSNNSSNKTCFMHA